MACTYRKKHPNEEACNAITTQPQMACATKTIRTRDLQRNNRSTADGNYRKTHPNEEAWNATTTQPQIACTYRKKHPNEEACNAITAEGLYRKSHPNEEAWNTTTTQPQMACIATKTSQQPLNRRWPASQKASERGGLQRNNHSTPDGLYRKKHPNEEACNATTTQPQMACIAKCLRTRRPATQQPLNPRWPVSQKASEREDRQRNTDPTADGLYSRMHPNEEACNATTTQPQMACAAKSI